MKRRILLAATVLASAAVLGVFAGNMPSPYYAVKPAGTDPVFQPQACIAVSSNEPCISTGTNPFCSVSIVKYDGTVASAILQDDQISATTCANPLRRLNP